MNRSLVPRTTSALGKLAKLVLLGLAACFVANCHAAGRAGPADLVGQPAPLFTGKTLDGAVVSMEELRGRVVVLDFWATWCSYCREAIPKVQAVSRRFEKDPVTVLGINLDKDAGPDQIAAFLKKHEITFGQVLDPDGHLKKKYGVRGIPCVFVIDTKGVARYVHVGDDADLEQQLGEHVASLLQGGRR